MAGTLDLALVRTFVVVSEQASFTASARLLGLSQSAVSLQVQRLEERVGSALLSRDPRQVRLTSSGRAFLAYARRLLALEDDALRQVREGVPAQMLRIGMPDVFALRYLAGLLEQLREQQPALQPTVICDLSNHLVAQFDRGQLDLCLTVKYEHLDGGRTIGSDDLLWAASEAFVCDESAPVALALFADDCVYRARGVRALAEAGRAWRLVYETQSTAAIELCVDQGWAVTLRSRRTMKPSWRDVAAEAKLPPLGTVSIDLRVSPRSDAPHLSAFAALVEQTVRDDLASQ